MRPTRLARLASRRRPDRPARDRALVAACGSTPGFTLLPGQLPAPSGSAAASASAAPSGSTARLGRPAVPASVGAARLRRSPRPRRPPSGSRPAVRRPRARRRRPSAGATSLAVRQVAALPEEPVHLRHAVGPARPFQPGRPGLARHLRDPAGDRDQARHVRHDHRRPGLCGRLRGRRLRRLLGPEDRRALRHRLRRSARDRPVRT